MSGWLGYHLCLIAGLLLFVYLGAIDPAIAIGAAIGSTTGYAMGWHERSSRVVDA